MKKRHVVIIAATAVTLAGGAIGCSKKPAVNNQSAQSATQDPTSTQDATNPTETPEATEKPEATTPSETPKADESVKETEKPKYDFEKLSNNDAISAAVKQITASHPQKLTSSSALNRLSKEESVIYTVSVFRSDVKKGLYEYFTGSDNATAALLANSLKTIGANNTKELFEDFIDSMRIDVTNTSKLSKIKKEDYSFDVFDDEYKQFSKSEDLTKLLADYIRANASAIK